MSGPTTHPKNHLDYLKVQGTVRTAPGGSFPPFEADIVDAGTWVQQEHLPSGQVWMRTEATALLRCYYCTSTHLFKSHANIYFRRVVEPTNTSADPAVAETETGVSSFGLLLHGATYNLHMVASSIVSINSVLG